MSPTNQQQTILIIDDNTTNLKVAVQHLQTVGNYKILTARHGEDGLKRVQLAQPDLILLDIQMPDIDGFEVCRRLKADPNTKDIPVIFMTAMSEVEATVQGFAVGAVDYITKPFKTEELLARVRTHLAIRSLQTDLEDRVAELDAFAHSVAHDLKNPLSRMMLGLDIVAEELTAAGNDSLQPIIKTSVKSSHQMLQIIDSLLLLASVRKQDVAADIVIMEDIVRAAHGRLEHMIADYQAKIIWPESWPSALGHNEWLEEVWVNFISNGLKYGGRPPRLELGSTSLNNGFIRFWVRDNGEGLTPEEQGRLFTEFTRLGQKKIDGHGLGLSIVKRILDKLNGRVGVKSQVGKGSIFYFELPAS